MTGGALGMVMLVAGTLLLDMAMQSGVCALVALLAGLPLGRHLLRERAPTSRRDDQDRASRVL
jgi:hypothetical protein